MDVATQKNAFLDDYAARRERNPWQSAAVDFIPGVGTAAMGLDALHSFGHGNILSGLGSTAMAGASLLPGGALLSRLGLMGGKLGRGLAAAGSGMTQGSKAIGMTPGRAAIAGAGGAAATTIGDAIHPSSTPFQMKQPAPSPGTSDPLSPDWGKPAGGAPAEPEPIKAAAAIRELSPFASSFLTRCLQNGMTADQTMLAIKKASIQLPEAAEEFEKIAFPGLKALLQRVAQGAGVAARGAGAAAPAVGLTAATGLGAYHLDDWIREKDPNASRTGRPVPENPLHAHAPRVTVPAPIDPLSPQFGQQLMEQGRSGPPIFGGFPGLTMPGGTKYGVDPELVKRAMGEMPVAPPQAPVDPSQQPVAPPATPVMPPSIIPAAQTTTGRAIPQPGAPPAPPAAPVAMPPVVPAPPHPHEAGVPAYPSMSKRAVNLSGVGKGLLSTGKSMWRGAKSLVGKAPTVAPAGEAAAGGEAALRNQLLKQYPSHSPEWHDARVRQAMSGIPTAHNHIPANPETGDKRLWFSPKVQQQSQDWSRYAPEVRDAGKQQIVKDFRDPLMASRVIHHLDSLAPPPAKGFWERPSGQLAMGTIPIAGLMGAEPLIGALSGPDRGQQQVGAAKTIGMHLSQAAALGDRQAFQRVVSQPGMHPGVAGGLQALWADRHGRQALSNPDTAANAVYMMHQHLQTNPNLTGEQLAQVVGSGMKSAAEKRALPGFFDDAREGGPMGEPMPDLPSKPRVALEKPSRFKGKGKHALIAGGALLAGAGTAHLINRSFRGEKRGYSLAETIGGLAGAAQAPKGSSTEGFGRGSLQGFGWDTGAEIGGIGGGIAGGLAGHGYGKLRPNRRIPTKLLGKTHNPMLSTLIGILGGSAVGGIGGGLTGAHVARRMQGPASYEKGRSEKKGSLPPFVRRLGS